MTPAPISVERLRELLDKATPGPWVTDDELPGRVFSDDATGSIIAQFDGFRFAPRADDEMSANTHLAAAAVNALPALLHQLAERAAEVERLTEEGRRDRSHFYREQERAEAAERAREEACAVIAELVNHARGMEVLLKISQQETTSKGVAFLAASGGA